MDNVNSLAINGVPDTELGPTTLYSVSRLNREVEAVLRGYFKKAIWVAGEIRGFKGHSTHLYFELCEKERNGNAVKASVSAVLWASHKPSILTKLRKASNGIELQDGLEVKFLCEVAFYVPGGKYQVKVIDVDPMYTMGKLYKIREEILARLRQKGLLESNKRLDLALVPLRVGLITSDGSAAYNDFINEVQSSGFSFRIFVYDARMQGRDTESQVCAGIRFFNERQPVDAIAVCRGGGSKTDLIWFDSEAIGEAIGRSRIPVLTGIGHEIDQSVADFAAGRSFKTPTAVAQFLVLRVSDFLQSAERSFERIIASAAEILARDSERVAKQLQLFCKDVRTIMNSDDTRLATLSARMATGLANSLARTDAGLMNRSQALGVHVMQRLGEGELRSSQKQGMLIAALRGFLKSQAQTVLHLTACLAPGRLDRLIARFDQDIEARSHRLPGAAALRMSLEEGRVETLQRVVNGYDPIHQLKLGYSILRDQTGKVVQRVEDVAVGEQLSAQVSDGFIGTKVISLNKGEHANGQGGQTDVQSSDD